MGRIVNGLTSFNWFNPENRDKVSQIAKDMELEFDNLERKALNPEAYRHHRKRITVLKIKLTKLFNKDTDEWLKARVAQVMEK